jgi:hypothetical protein
MSPQSPQQSTLSFRPGLFGAGIAQRLAFAAAVIVVLWIAAAWAVTGNAHPQPQLQPTQPPVTAGG